MKTADLVARIQAADPKVKKADAMRVVRLMIAELQKATAAGEDVMLPGFGVFRTVDRPGEEGGKRLVFRPAKSAAAAPKAADKPGEAASS